jgi:alginate O-acetyltransferase complex protein AlgI
MIFNTFTFAFFLFIVFSIYWLLRKNLFYQNLFLLIASYVFYGWWDWRFLSLIAISSFSDYIIGISIAKERNWTKRKSLLILSLFLNLGMLGFFKYFNFFTDSFYELMLKFGMEVSPTTLNIVLPVGISFYTFQTLSYTIDIYRQKLKPTTDILSFFVFVSFFPQLVAGPIERASNLLPQFTKQRFFSSNKAKDGLRQMLWGFFKKMIVADNLSSIADQIFDDPSQITGLNLILGLFVFSIQIYADFSGYSDIAIGVSRLFGFDLKRNFRYPLFARDVAERWRNWHISLSTWFRDYLYIPLGGSKMGKWGQIRNVMILFSISGLWHGSNWTFVFWGVLNGLFFVPSMLTGKNRRYLGVIAENRILPNITEVFLMLRTFALISLTYIFFRAENLAHSLEYMQGIIYNDFWRGSFADLKNISGGMKYLGIYSLYVAILLVFEWRSRTKEHGLEIANWPIVLRWGTYYFFMFSILTFGAYNKQAFIYFQF